MAPRVTIQADLCNRPYDHEMTVAIIMANFFRTDVIFLRPNKNKTPDLEINGELWEIKSPKGGSKKTIENNLRNAKKHSQNVVLDLQRCKLPLNQAIARTNFFLKGPHSFKKFLIISKSQEVRVILPIDKVGEKP